MDADNQRYANYKLRDLRVAKAYELNSGVQDNQAYKALRVPSFVRQLFIGCAEAAEEGATPLRACLVEISQAWNEPGFAGECPVTFGNDELKRHEQQFKEYRKYHNIHELARETLGTEASGWIMPQADFEARRKENEELL